MVLWLPGGWVLCTLWLVESVGRSGRKVGGRRHRVAVGRAQDSSAAAAACCLLLLLATGRRLWAATHALWMCAQAVSMAPVGMSGLAEMLWYFRREAHALQKAVVTRRRWRPPCQGQQYKLSAND